MEGATDAVHTCGAHGTLSMVDVPDLGGENKGQLSIFNLRMGHLNHERKDINKL